MLLIVAGIVPPPNEMESQENGESKVCSKCQEEFPSLPDLLQHMKTCLNNKRPLDLEDTEDDAPPSKIMNGDVASNCDVTEDLMTREVNASLNGTEFDNPESVPVSQTSEKSDDLSDLGDEDKDNGMMEDDLDDDDDDLLDEDTMDDDLEKSEVGVFPGSMVYPIPTDSNVKLEKLESTKVAVAQFAENNLPNLPQMDLPSLQTMLYSLHQQQVMQLQLLTQLQQQLMTGVTPSFGQMMMAGIPAAAAAAITASSTATSSSSTSNSSQEKPIKPETPSTPQPPSIPPAAVEATPKTPVPPTPSKNPFEFFNSPLLNPPQGRNI